MFSKYFYLIVFFCFVYISLFAQKSKHDFSLESMLNDQDTLVPKGGIPKPNKSDANIQAAKAVSEAIEAYKQESAEGLKNKSYRKLRNQCEEALQLSEKVGDKALQLKILPYLRLLAEWKKDLKELEIYTQKMSTLQVSIKPIQVPGGNYKPTSAEPAKTNVTTNPSTQSQAPTVIYVASPSNDKETPSPKAIAAEKARQEKEKVLMLDILKEHKEAVQSMNEAQAKNALLELQQRSLLDSFNYIKITDSLAMINKDLELNENKAELRIQASQKKFSWAIALLVALFAVGVFYRFRKERKYSHVLAEKNALIAKEKERSEELLLNILPVSVAEELKTNGLATARHYESVTVLFTDFKGFTNISSQLSPQALVADLDYCFRKFDEIVLKYGLEKIKTIGDSYMVASGIPEVSKDHALRMIRASKEMIAFTNEWKTQKMEDGKPYFEVRIGVNTGPIVAGVVGSKKFAYDIWGDTVNIASRMESSGEVGRINISDATYQLVKKEFICTHRGKVIAKNTGEIDMYFVN